MTAGSKRFGSDRLRLAPVVVVTEQDHVSLVLSIVEPIEIGRECSGLTLLDASISRRHLALNPTAEGLFVADLGSLNGSNVDGQPLLQPHRLAAGETVRFGTCALALASAQPSGNPPANRSVEFPDHPRASSIRLLADVVLERGPMIPLPDDPGTVTIVFTGIDISMPQGMESGDARWHEALSVHDQILRTMLARHDGTELDTLAGAMMICFRSARSALAFVIGARRGFAAYEAANPTAGLRIRAGIHTGEVAAGDDGLFVAHAVMAAAIADQAQRGETLVSSLVREILECRSDHGFDESRRVTLDGLAGTHLVHSVVG